VPDRQRKTATPGTVKKSTRPLAAIVLDSSCWLEFFADTERADLYAAAIEQTELLVVPVLTVYEVVKKLARETNDEVTAAALSLMQRGRVISLDLPLALDAVTSGLPLADSIIYATARRFDAELWTQDSHFEGLVGVRYFPKPVPKPVPKPDPKP
jgi:toxin FitB